MALAHLLLRIIYQMLSERIPYHELGRDYVLTKQRNVDYWVRRIQEMGYDVQIHETEIA